MGRCFALLYNSLSGTRRLRLKKGSGDTNKKTLGESLSDREESEGVDLWTLFQIDSSALHFIRIVGNYQETTSAKHAALMRLVGIDTHC